MVHRLPEAPIVELLRTARTNGATDIFVGDLEWQQLAAYHAKIGGQVLQDDEPLTMAGVRLQRARAVSCWIPVKRV